MDKPVDNGDRRTTHAGRSGGGPMWALARLGVRVTRPVVVRTGIDRAAERIALDAIDAVLGSRLVQEAVDRALVSGLADEIAKRVFEGPELERIAAAALDSPGVGRVAEHVVNSPSTERLVAGVIDSRLMDEAVARLLESEDLWILIDEVARSPAVTDAISHQGMGFADQVAAAVRERSRRADARLEHAARRLVRRSANGDSGSSES